MTDTKTEWHVVERLNCWRVVAGSKVIADYLDKPTAHRIAAVNELEAALTGPEDSPQLWHIEWLATLVSSLGDLKQLQADCDEDPDAFAELRRNLEALVTEGRAALAKARGQ